ncbi:hypothetical protein X975_11867, partial [Stegodyphus mimosarum]
MSLQRFNPYIHDVTFAVVYNDERFRYSIRCARNDRLLTNLNYQITNCYYL